MLSGFEYADLDAGQCRRRVGLRAGGDSATWPVSTRLRCVPAFERRRVIVARGVWRIREARVPCVAVPSADRGQRRCLRVRRGLRQTGLPEEARLAGGSPEDALGGGAR